MGLFVRKAVKSNSSGGVGSALVVNIPNRSDNDITPRYQGSDKKREFCKPSNSEDSMIVDKGTIATHSTKSDSTSEKYRYNKNIDVNATSQEVQLLEQQLRKRNATIFQLFQTTEASEKAQSERMFILERQVERLVESSSRTSQLLQTMEASEKVQSERIHFLERQLECLFDLSPSDCSVCRSHDNSSLPLNLSNENKRQDVTENDYSHHNGLQGHQDQVDEIEISTLEELLARAVAEKDRLILNNDNSKSVLKDGRNSGKACYSSISNESSNMPSSIEELDSMIEDLDGMIRHEHNMKYRGDINNCQQDQHIELNDECYEGNCFSDNVHHIRKESNEDGRSPPASSEEQHPVYYKMSCRNSTTDQSDINYVGCLSTASNNTAEDLTTIVSHHFSQVWEMMQEQQDDGNISLSIHNGDGLDRERSNNISGINSGSFPSSSLARCLVTEHCQQFCQEEEVLQWCMKNIKVSIKGDDGEQIPSRKKKRQSKIRNKRRVNRISA